MITSLLIFIAEAAVLFGLSDKMVLIFTQNEQITRLAADTVCYVIMVIGFDFFQGAMCGAIKGLCR